MNQTIAIPRRQHVRRERGPYPHVLLAALLGGIIGSLAFAILASTVDVVQQTLANETATTESVPPYPARELPAEWRGYREPVEYEHMYRTDPAPQLDWIR
jgi:hypothetical protein